MGYISYFVFQALLPFLRKENEKTCYCCAAVAASAGSRCRTGANKKDDGGFYGRAPGIIVKRIDGPILYIRPLFFFFQLFSSFVPVGEPLCFIYIYSIH